MNIKKLIATLAFALGAWMSGVAIAQTAYPGDTSYNFSATFAGGSYDLVSTGTVWVNPSNGNVDSFSNIVMAGTTQSSIDYDSIGSSQNLGYSGPYLPIGGTVSIPLSGNPVNYSFVYSFGGGGYGALITSDPNQSFSFYGDWSSYGNAVLSANSAVAPEMNASFIPQVGLLLGCLFFLFGRKKEVVLPLLTV